MIVLNQRTLISKIVEQASTLINSIATTLSFSFVHLVATCNRNGCFMDDNMANNFGGSYGGRSVSRNGWRKITSSIIHNLGKLKLKLHLLEAFL